MVITLMKLPCYIVRVWHILIIFFARRYVRGAVVLDGGKYYFPRSILQE